ncbi:hypothetical protein [Bradyrhizobium valentinum]|uniref:hypothetical protein n=1 Tax=Bradyrhizobium valentinum TaxID=1518501 RepID=UPI00070F4FFF|nr:hypothetical protein [Bradyrhizobium valentinum]KRR12475.1 hypothetical protein CQ10_39690 [Bradyrhizobium valentinum]
MMETKVEVPAPVRELGAIGINNAESALALFFDAVSKLGAPTSAQSLALLERIVAVRMDYARKVARAIERSEATALQFAFCRSQIDITTELIRVVSGSVG